MNDYWRGMVFTGGRRSGKTSLARQMADLQRQTSTALLNKNVEQLRQTMAYIQKMYGGERVNGVLSPLRVVMRDD